MALNPTGPTGPTGPVTSGAAPFLACEGLVATRGGRRVLDGIDLAFHPGSCVGVVGPNGAGKSTLLMALAGLIRPEAGQVRLHGSDLSGWRPRARAREIACLPQARDSAWPIPTRDLVALGRFAHAGPFGGASPADIAETEAAMAACGIASLADRPVDTLSGGEAARAHLARALAAGTGILIADEPAAGLDPAQALGVARILAGRAAAGCAVLAAFHEIALARNFCTRVIALREGRIIADGPPDSVLSADGLHMLYGVAPEDQRLAGL